MNWWSYEKCDDGSANGESRQLYQTQRDLKLRCDQAELAEWCGAINTHEEPSRKEQRKHFIEDHKDHQQDDTHDDDNVDDEDDADDDDDHDDDDYADGGYDDCQGGVYVGGRDSRDDDNDNGDDATTTGLGLNTPQTSRTKHDENDHRISRMLKESAHRLQRNVILLNLKRCF